MTKRNGRSARRGLSSGTWSELERLQGAGAQLQQGRRRADGQRHRPVYAPNSYGGPQADPSRTDRAGLWAADGEMVRSAYTLRADDDDFGQAGTMVREVLDDDARERLVSNVAGHLLDGVSEDVLARAFQYWKNIDQEIGGRIEQAVGATVGA
jgi:catalase